MRLWHIGLWVAFALPLQAEMPPPNFSPERLVPWCIVPFDAGKRGPQERARMLVDLGLKRCAYDWRAEHVESFEAEILAYKEHGIEFTAFWGVHEKAFDLFEKHRLSPQIWLTSPSPDGDTQQARVATAVAALVPIAERCKKIGSTLGLYNHGGWGGEPENLVAICKALQGKGYQVGIVYNFHHAHARIASFAADIERMLPQLIAVNLNGMNDGAKPKILSIGKGTHEKAMIQALIRSGYTGPIGILDHLSAEDSEVVLRRNLEGLAWLLSR